MYTKEYELEILEGLLRMEGADASEGSGSVKIVFIIAAVFLTAAGILYYFTSVDVLYQMVFVLLAGALLGTGITINNFCKDSSLVNKYMKIDAVKVKARIEELNA